MLELAALDFLFSGHGLMPFISGDVLIFFFDLIAFEVFINLLFIEIVLNTDLVNFISLNTKR